MSASVRWLWLCCRSSVRRCVLDTAFFRSHALQLLEPGVGALDGVVLFHQIADAKVAKEGEDDKTDLRISAESIKETPGTLQEIHETREAHIDNAIISVRAIDLDNRTKGWFGLINGVKDRLPIALDPSIDAERIHGTIYADIILMYERKSTSEPFKPVKIVIKRMGSSDLPVGAIPVVRNPSLDLTAATPSPQHPQQPTLFE